MKPFRIIASVTVAISLAACGSSGGGSSEDEIDLPAEFSNLEDLLTQADEGTLNAAGTSLMSGTVDMTGAIGVADVGDDGDDEVIGNLSLSVNFNDGSVSGSASGFDVYDSNGTQGDAITGTLTVSGAAGSVTGATFTADVDGTLMDGPDNITVDGAIDGDFYDYNGDLATTGDFDATLITAAGSENVEGGFAAIAD